MADPSADERTERFIAEKAMEHGDYAIAFALLVVAGKLDSLADATWHMALAVTDWVDEQREDAHG